MLRIVGIGISDPMRMFIIEDIYVQDESGQLYLVTQIEENDTLSIEEVDAMPNNLDWYGSKAIDAKISRINGKLQLIENGCVSKHINTGVC